MPKRCRAMVIAGTVAATFAPRFAPAGPNDFVLIHMPDTQNYSQYESGNNTRFHQQTAWIVNQKALFTQNPATGMNIAFVAQVGDVTNQGWQDYQWATAVSAMQSLKNSTIPFGLAPGNHDVMEDASPTLYNSTKFIDNFGPQYFAGKSFYLGASPSKFSSAQTFTGGGRQFIVLSMDIDPTQAEFNWAQSVIDANPGKPVIYSTHEYLGNSGRDTGLSVPTAGRNTGEQQWTKFIKKNDEIFLVINGHIKGQHQQRSFNDAGHEVTEILADYQALPNHGNGWLRTMTFNPDTGQVSVQTYSPTLGRTLQTQDRDVDLGGSEGEDGAPGEIGAFKFFVDLDRRFSGADIINKVTWQTATSGSFSELGRWTDNVTGLAAKPPGSGRAVQLTFPGAASYTATSDMGITLPPPVNLITFSNSAGVVTIAGTSPLDMRGNGTSSTATISDTGAGTVVINAPIILSTGTTATINGDFTVGNTIGGTGNFTKNGAGNLIFTSGGRFSTTGDITINAGFIRLAANGAIPSTATVTVASGATLDDSYSSAGGEGFGGLAGSGTFLGRAGLNLGLGEADTTATFAGRITAGTNGTIGGLPAARQLLLRKGGTGAIVLTGTTSDYAGQTQILLGTLSVPLLPNRTLNGPLGVGDIASFGDGSGGNVGVDITIGDAATATTLATDATLRYTGATASTNRTIAALGLGGTLEVTTVGTNLTLSGAITGAGTLIKTGAGTLTLATDPAAPMSANAGKLVFAANAPTKVGVALAGGSVDAATGSSAFTFGKTVTGTGVFTKSGAGTLALTADSTFAATVDLQVSAGTLQTAANDPFPSAFVVTISSGATWDDSFGNGENLGGIAGAGRWIERAGTSPSIGGTASSAVFSGQITAGLDGVVGAAAADRALNLNKVGTGTLTLTGSTSNFQGKVHVQAGQLAFSNLANRGTASALALGSTGATADIVVGTPTQTAVLRYTGGSVTTDRRVELQHATGSAIEVSSAATTLGVGIVTGANATAGLTKAGAGTLLLNGDATYTGATTVSAGKLALGKSLVTSSSIDATGGTVELLAGGDKVIKTASVSATGTGRIDLRDNKLIVTGQSSNAVNSLVAAGRNAGAWNGAGIVTSMSQAASSTFLTTLAVATAGEANKQTFGGQSVAATDVLVMYTYAGDANLSGLVDADDYFQIDSNYNKPAGSSSYFNGDFNYDGRLDGDDYAAIDASFSGQTARFASAALAGVSIVPEPVSAAIVAAGGLLAAGGRRRRAVSCVSANPLDKVV